MLEIRPILSALWLHKSRAVLIIAQIALTLAIVSNALFIVDERIALIKREHGFAQQQLFDFFTVSLNTGGDASAQIEADEQMLREIPGVINAVAANHTPISGSGSATNFSLSSDSEADSTFFNAGVFRGDEHLLETLGVTLIEGRNFTPEEVHYGPNSPDSVVIINKALADKVFPDGDALGKTIYNHPRAAKIIGIVGVMQGFWVNASFFNENVIFPNTLNDGFKRYLVRTEVSERENVMAQVKEKMLALSNDRVIGDTTTLEENIESSYQNHSAMMKILAIIIALLLSITMIGIFGLSSFSVNQRTKQIGTRRALGASKWHVIRYFLVENALMSGVGIAIGFILAVALNALLVDLYGVSKLNNAYVLATMFGIFIVSLLAVAIPAMRAASISPASATK